MGLSTCRRAVFKLMWFECFYRCLWSIVLGSHSYRFMRDADMERTCNQEKNVFFFERMTVGGSLHLVTVVVYGMSSSFSSL
mmetsp:Transcript_104858/g.157034  ORF Transcript_104858/g.157034 Transcript_104858/m.157034 type:complete len:81 (+) Transcript_104858:46-288(+)